MHRELNEAEKSLLRKMGGHARKAALDAGISKSPDSPLSPEALDQLWSEWDWSNLLAEDEQRLAISFFGFAFGEYLSVQTGMQWRIVSDEHGDDYALVKPSTDVTAFPLATVGKRLGGAPFFASIAPAMINDVRSAPAQAKKPWWKVW